MIQELLWTLAWMLIRWILNVSKDMVARTVELVAEAQTKKHEDGTYWTGTEKYEWVFDNLFGSVDMTTDHSIYNTLIELAVAYLKKKAVA